MSDMSAETAEAYSHAGFTRTFKKWTLMSNDKAGRRYKMKSHLTEKDWREIGNQSKQAREELFKLLRMSEGNLPKEVTKRIIKAISELDGYRCKAEDHMLITKGSEDLTVFFGSGQ